MKYSELKKSIIDANKFVSQRIYDRRYQDFFTVTKREKLFYTVKYENRNTAPIKESVASFLNYFESKVYSIAIEQNKS